MVRHHSDAVNVTLKDVPDDLHKRLQLAASESGRSLNKLILVALQREFCPRRIPRARLLERIRRRRKGMKAWIDDQGLREAVEEGRA